MNKPYETGRLYPLSVPDILREVREDEHFVLLETARVIGEERTSYLFRDPVSELKAYNAHDADRLHEAMNEALSRGYFLAGWWAYEWGYALEPKLRNLLPESSSAPLVWLGVFEKPETWNHERAAISGSLGDIPDITAHIGHLALDCDQDQYADAVNRIKEYIALGHTYQVNHTIRGRFAYTGSPTDLYLALRARQAVSYGALIRNGSRWILSLSPELFFRLEGDRIWSKPMKGTINRGRTTREDEKLASFLAHDPKNRAENIMIVDLLRNDLGRLSRHGSVHVPKLFSVERYATLFQMISRVEGRLRKDVTWKRIFKSLFPCGSVTGAPKIRTMEIIAELENSPRGVYTGSVGFIAPGGKAVLNVAIRTVVLDGTKGEVGIGSGVTMDSDPIEEFRECRLKADFLTNRYHDFRLLETMLWETEKAQEKPISGYHLLNRHLERLKNSALYFSFACDAEEIVRSLSDFASRLDRNVCSHRVRLLLSRNGRLDLSSAPVAFHADPPNIAVSPRKVDSGDPFLFHKTTRRTLYSSELEQAQSRGLFDVVFTNEKGELTEGTFTNIFIERAGTLLTPALECGLLNGTLRQELLSTGKARETVIKPEDLRRCDAVYVGNSVRGLLKAAVVSY